MSDENNSVYERMRSALEAQRQARTTRWQCPRCDTEYLEPTATECDWCPGVKLFPIGGEVV